MLFWIHWALTTVFAVYLTPKVLRKYENTSFLSLFCRCAHTTTHFKILLFTKIIVKFQINLVICTLSVLSKNNLFLSKTFV